MKLQLHLLLLRLLRLLLHQAKLRLPSRLLPAAAGVPAADAPLAAALEAAAAPAAAAADEDPAEDAAPAAAPEVAPPAPAAAGCCGCLLAKLQLLLLPEAACRSSTSLLRLH